MIPKFRAWHHKKSRMMSLKNIWFQNIYQSPELLEADHD